MVFKFSVIAFVAAACHCYSDNLSILLQSLKIRWLLATSAKCCVFVRLSVKLQRWLISVWLSDVEVTTRCRSWSAGWWRLRRKCHAYFKQWKLFSRKLEQQLKPLTWWSVSGAVLTPVRCWLIVVSSHAESCPWMAVKPAVAVSVVCPCSSVKLMLHLQCYIQPISMLLCVLACATPLCDSISFLNNIERSCLYACM